MSESKKLKTLEEHNHQRYELNKRLNSGEPILNGIACPMGCHVKIRVNLIFIILLTNWF